MIPQKFTKIDIASCVAANTTPSCIFTRHPSSTWLVMQSPFADTDEPRWAAVSSDTHVYVPIFRYTSHNADPADAVAFAAGIGADAAASLPETALATHVVYGNVVDHDVTAGKFSIYLGFAFQTR